MICLDSIILLNHALKKLNEGKRDQVPISVLPEIQQVVKLATVKIGMEPNPAYRIAYEDLTEAIVTAQSLSGMLNLTDKMKQTLVDGIESMKATLCGLAYDYYSTHDFEVNDSIIPVMREVVQTKLLGGC